MSPELLSSNSKSSSSPEGFLSLVALVRFLGGAGDSSRFMGMIGLSSLAKPMMSPPPVGESTLEDGLAPTLDDGLASTLEEGLASKLEVRFFGGGASPICKSGSLP